ncbi:hypothetical protein BH20CHL6_BH20CHL6_16280 [soil metagenome]
MPPIAHLQRPPLIHLQMLERQGVFTTGLFLEVSETRTRRQYLADQIGATTNDVNAWRDEALLLNLAGFGPPEQALFTQAGILGLAGLISMSLEQLEERIDLAARALGMEPPTELQSRGWWEQAQTLAED